MKTIIVSFKFVQRTLPNILIALVAWGLSLQSAQADYLVTLQQVGSDVVATGTGTLDLAGLTPLGANSTLGSEIIPSGGDIATGMPVIVSEYTGFTGPTSFGSGAATFTPISSGPIVTIDGSLNDLQVPLGYSSGDPLSDSATYSGASFTTLGVTPGTYEWTWGVGDHASSFTLQIGPAAGVPDPGSTLSLLCASLAGLFVAARLRTARAA